jgi:hypothetical protein
MWGGAENNGEFMISGGHFMTTAGAWDSIFDGAVAVTGLNNGVACQDGHTGTGYILYSEENIHTRFAAASPHADNAENFICAVFDAASSQWSYDTNGNHVVFAPRDTDLLVAAVDFTNDLITSGAGVSGTVGGIAFGYSTGDLSFAVNQWGGSDNAGEFGITGSFFQLSDSAGADVDEVLTIGTFNNGVACQDGATGTGYMMYSAESVHSRFASDAVHGDNANHFVCVIWDGSQWLYDTNGAYVAFAPRSDSDVLVASLDFSADTATSAQGLD